MSIYVTAADEGYLEPLTVMLKSLSVFVSDNDSVYVLHVNIAAQDQQNIKNEVRGVNLLFVEMSGFIVKCPEISKKTKDRYSITTYFRFFIQNVIPVGGRVLYIDADIVVNSDPEDLFSIDLDRNCVAAVRDAVLVNRNRALNVHQGDYFNAGVLLIDLDSWDQEKVSEKALKYLASSPNDKLDYNDQDALNAMLENRIKWLGARWNLQSAYKNDCASPVFIHFTGEDKPWYFHSLHKYKKYYIVIRRQTFFGDSDLKFFIDTFDKKLLAELKGEVGEVVLWGAGIRGRRIYSAIKESIPDLNVIAFFDRNPPVKEFDSIPVVVPTLLDGVDKIIVCSAECQQEIMRDILQQGYTCDVLSINNKD